MNSTVPSIFFIRFDLIRCPIDIEMHIESIQIVEHRHRHRIKSNQIIKKQWELTLRMLVWKLENELIQIWQGND